VKRVSEAKRKKRQDAFDELEDRCAAGRKAPPMAWEEYEARTRAGETILIGQRLIPPTSAAEEFLNSRIGHIRDGLYDTFDRPECKSALQELLVSSLPWQEDPAVKWFVEEAQRHYLTPPSKQQRRNRERLQKARLYNLIIEEHDRRGETAEKAYDFIIELFGEPSYEAIDQHLYRASTINPKTKKPWFGEIVPRYDGRPSYEHARLLAEIDKK
jgi:hypothetical protein